MNIPESKLNTGAKMPGIGFGTWQLAEGPEAKNSVLAAIKAGYRLIDTAKIYGNEQSVGEAIRQSGAPREQLFVTTKLWTSDQGYDSALKAFGDSLERLGLGYVELYLIHWPGHNGSNRLESWRALEEIQKSGKSKAVGVSNFGIEHLKQLASSSKVTPAVNQIEFNPFIYDQQAPILDYCKTHNIAVEAYSPLAHGRKMDNPVINQIAKTHAKSDAQIMLRWAVQHGTVPIPKSANTERIKQNLEIFDFELSDKQMRAINGLGNSKSSLPFLVRLLK